MRTLLGLTVAAALVLASPAVAHAQTWKHTDPTHDEWYAADTDEPIANPTATEADITGLQLNHNRRYVQLFMTTVALDPSHYDEFDLAVRNGRGQITDFSITPYNATRTPTLTIYGRNYRAKKCGGTIFKVNFTSGRVAITAPRSCFSNPQYVRVELASTYWQRANNGASGDGDDGLSKASPPAESKHHGTWVGRG